MYTMLRKNTLFCFYISYRKATVNRFHGVYIFSSSKISVFVAEIMILHVCYIFFAISDIIVSFVHSSKTVQQYSELRQFSC